MNIRRVINAVGATLREIASFLRRPLIIDDQWNEPDRDKLPLVRLVRGAGMSSKEDRTTIPHLALKRRNSTPRLRG